MIWFINSYCEKAYPLLIEGFTWNIMLIFLTKTVFRHLIGDLFYVKQWYVYSAGYLMRKKQIAVICLALWLTIISCFMLLTGRFELALFFVLGFIGFLLIVMIMEPHYVKPSYSRYIRYIIIIGIVIAGAVVVQKLMEILGLYFTWSFW